MGVFSKVYKGPAGGIQILGAELVNVEILSVKRDGVGYTQSDTVPTGFERKFLYIPGVGSIFFSADNPFAGPPVSTSDDVYEYIFVMYKI